MELFVLCYLIYEFFYENDDVCLLAAVRSLFWYTLFMISHHAKRLFSFVKKSFFLVFAFWFLFSAHATFAAMSSSNYLLQWDSFSVGATDTQSSSSYRVRSSIDLSVSAEDMGSSSYGLDGGYRGGVYDPVSTFRIFSQSLASQVAATSFSGNTVVVTSASGFAVGDRVLLVQDEGTSQVSAMGSISSILGGSISVDMFSGGSPAIDGSGDYLYKMTSDGTTLPLGGPTSSTVVTGVIGWEATADIQTGYSVYLLEDTNLVTAGLDEIPDVADGSVTLGTSEYGAVSSDTSLSSSTFDSEDTAITSSPQLVASRATVTFEGRDYITLKLAISSSQQGGAYSQNLTLLFAGNY